MRTPRSTPADPNAVLPFPPARRGNQAQTVPILSDRERLILSLLRDSGETTRSALIRRTGLSGTAVFRATEELAAAGLILLGEPKAEGRGQPSHAVSLNPSASYAVGLSVMTDLIEIVLIDLAGRPVCSQLFPNSRMTPEAAVLQLQDFLVAAEKRRGVDLRQLQAISIAVAGFFIGEGALLNPSSQLDPWALVDLRTPFETAFGIPVTIENIANASAVGEQLLGLGRNFNSFAYVNVAAGFGGGIILDGRLWRGVNGNAGEFAAVLESPPNLETLRDVLAGRGVETANVLDMVERFDMGWPGVDLWVAQSGDRFARLAQIIHATMDLEAMVLGGRLPRTLADALAQRATAGLGGLFPPPRRGRGRPQPQICAAEINAGAAAIGAAAIPLSQLYYDPIAHLNRTEPAA